MDDITILTDSTVAQKEAELQERHEKNMNDSE